MRQKGVRRKTAVLEPEELKLLREELAKAETNEEMKKLFVQYYGEALYDMVKQKVYLEVSSQIHTQLDSITDHPSFNHCNDLRMI